MIIRNDRHLNEVAEEMQELWEELLIKYPNCDKLKRVDIIFNAMLDYEEQN